LALAAGELRVPSAPTDADALAALAEEWRLEAAIQRLQRALDAARAG
jgi:hypothetical protein